MNAFSPAWLVCRGVACLGPVILSCATLVAADIRCSVAESSPPVSYALRQLAVAAGRHGDTLTTVEAGARADLRLHIDAALGAEAFRVAPGGATVDVFGGDPRGLMYGVLTLAEQVARGGALAGVAAQEVHPSVGFRALKFNLPWAGYRNAPSIEIHQDVCRDPRFWEQFLDMMAANRFNVLTLWSLHPFPYFVVPRSFPEAASLPAAEQQEFHALWTKVFALAKERGIETYLINWNVFVSPGFARAHHVAEYSRDLGFIGEGETSPLVEAYTRECVEQTLEEYPDLTGLGITLGERMGGMSPAERRAWVDRAIVPGILAAKRPCKFIYRAPLSADTKSGGTTSADNDRATRAHIESIAAKTGQPVYVEFKYNWSHGHSSPQLFIVHGGVLSDAYWNPPPRGYQVVWTVRNEDFHVLRWGGPDFVRDFEAHNFAPHVGGVIVGSEVFIPAKDVVSLEGPHRTWRYDFQRQWLFFATWGRTLYSPATADDALRGLFADRFGGALAPALLDVWRRASTVPTRFASFVRGTWDGDLYTEGFGQWRDRQAASGVVLIDVRSLIRHPVLDPKYVNVADFVAAGDVVPAGKTSPLALADDLEATADDLARRVAGLRTAAGARDDDRLEAELADLEAWGAFSRYFAEKLRGAVALARFERTNDPALQAQAVAALRRARSAWRALADAGARFNHAEILFQPRAPFSWQGMLAQVDRDIALAEAASPRAP